MSTQEDRKIGYHLNKFLATLIDGQTAGTKSAITDVQQKISNVFSSDLKSVPDFLELDYGNDLPELMTAGVNSLEAGLYEADLAKAKASPHYAAYVSVIISRQYFSGTVDGSVENLRRKSRMLAKFREHCPDSDLTIDNPAHPLRTAFIKTPGRWLWANEKATPVATPVPPASPKKVDGKADAEAAAKAKADAEAAAKAKADAEAAAKAKADAEAAAKVKTAAPPPPPPAAPKAKEIPAVVTKDFAAAEMQDTNFFKSLHSEDSSRDYTIIVDKSSSMKLGGRWKQAEDAVKALAESACKCDEDGISLYFFSSHSRTSKGEFPAFSKYENVKTTAEVMRLFALKENAPKGGTDLTRVLQDAFSQSGGKPQSILVITDGVPDDTKSAENLIIATGNALPSPDMLHLTVVQVGDDKRADEYLHELDSSLTTLGAKYDIVDVISNKILASLDFAEIVKLAAPV